MKPTYFRKYRKASDASFLVIYAEVPYTYNRFHYHDEYELSFNIENRGTRFVGDSIERFDYGDLVLIGPNTPHFWRSDDIYFEGNKDLKAKVVVVQFSKNFLGKAFFDIPEMQKVQMFLEKTSRGIQVHGEVREKIATMTLELLSITGWEQLLKLLNILCVLSETENITLLASPGFNHSSWIKHESKVSRVFNYIMNNYKREITLDEVAQYSNMNKSAFCRYFRKAANKTYSQALNEIRIGFACKEIIYSDKNIAEIAFDCGYANVTYFNRVFKQIKNLTPINYRNYNSIKEDCNL